MLELPLHPVCRHRLFVFVGADAPTGADALALVPDWLARHADPPLRDDLISALARWPVEIETEPNGPGFDPSSMPAPVPETTDERARREAASHVLQIVSPDRLRPPLTGLWLGLATARALAEATGGLIHDPLTYGPLLPSLMRLRIPARGRLAVAPFLQLPWSIDPDGTAAMTTHDLRRLGLPNLSLAGAPPSLAGRLRELILAVAQLLLIKALHDAVGSGEPLTTMLVPPTLMVPSQVLAAALDVPAGELPAGRSGQAAVGLSWDGAPQPHLGGEEPLLTLGPPAGFAGTAAEWVWTALDDLVGVHRDPQELPAEAVAGAAARARAELPAVRQRYLGGTLRPGDLLVKVGFELPAGGAEHMWVEVIGWEGDRIEGLLANRPRQRDDLAAGRRLSLHQDSIEDWRVASEAADPA